MKSKVLFGLVTVAVLSSMLVGVSYGQGGNSLGVVGSRGTTYTFTLSGEGQSWSLGSMGSTLSSLSDRDTFKMTLSVKLTITIVVADCCVMGDTIAVFHPTSTAVKMSATSPKIIVGTAVLAAGTYTFWVGYTACPGGFPASYFLWIIATRA